MTSTRCCSTRPARSRSATARRPSSSRSAGSARRSSPTRRSCPAWPTRPPRVARSSCWPRSEYGLRERPAGELSHATFVPFTAQTRMSGVDLAEPGGVRQIRKGASASVQDWVRQAGGAVPAELGQVVDGISSAGGTPLVVAESGPGGRPCARRHPPQGHRQARHARALRRAARDGHPHGDDHRRQPADREGDRRRGRRRRLPRRGHAGRQDGVDPQRADRRQARRDDR